jgi:hypothetical protein
MYADENDRKPTVEEMARDIKRLYKPSNNDFFEYLALRVVRETDLLEYVEQEWYPTTVLVCKTWRDAHVEKGICPVDLNDDFNIYEAAKSGMVVTSMAIERVFRSCECWKQKEFDWEFYQLEKLLLESCVPQSSFEEAWQTYYDEFIRLTFDHKHGFTSTLFWKLNEERCESSTRRLLEVDVYFIADAISRIGDLKEIKEVVGHFVTGTCVNCDHFDNDNWEEECRCHDNRYRVIFARAAVEYNEQYDDVMEWALDILDRDE